MKEWLGLMIGNSRLHWAYCQTNALETIIQHTWDSHHLAEEKAAIQADPKQSVDQTITQSINPTTAPQGILPPELDVLLSDCRAIPLLVASVVPTQTKYWQRYFHTSAQTRVITLEDIPLTHLYPTLGIDRALAVLGAWQAYQMSTLVIDGGTALTMTGVNAEGQLMGGAILPGLGLQLRSLHQQTAALPQILFEEGPPITRWQTNTPDSIRSGVWYSLLAGVKDFVEDWLHHYSESMIVFTGGDGQTLWEAMNGAIASQWPHTTVLYEPHIIFKGMSAILQIELRTS